jgi:hypothetical protein
MERYQSVYNRITWLNEKDLPLLLLFISHRWESDQSPDPSGEQFKAICSFLRLIPKLIEATIVPREKRLALVPDVALEGVLQAQEIARRILGFGTFDDRNWVSGAREKIVRQYEHYKGNSEQFQSWILQNIGLWLDYTCMPQQPFSGNERQRFISTLENLDTLVSSSTLLALRSDDDDYSTRGWCSSEFFLSSSRSHQRGVFVNLNHLGEPLHGISSDVPILSPDLHSAGFDIIREGYYNDLAAFKAECHRWANVQPPLYQVTPPDLWSNYRMLQGSSFYPKENDPNPMRPVMEAIKNIEVWLMRDWILGDEVKETEPVSIMAKIFKEQGLHCAHEEDLIYLACMIPRHGWVPFLKPFLEDCFSRLMRNGKSKMTSGISVRLLPLAPDVRRLFQAVRPASPEVWQSRFQFTRQSSKEEALAVSNVVATLNNRKPEYEFL